MPASLTLLRAVGGSHGARLFTGGRGPFGPLETAPAWLVCMHSEKDKRVNGQHYTEEQSVTCNGRWED